MNSEARNRVMAARTTLVLDEPFFGQLAPRLALVESTRNKTAWTDGKSMGYNATFVLGLRFKQLVGLVVHEVLHCAHGHMWRRAGRKHKRWNIACDLAINAELRRMKFELPDRALYPEQYKLPEGKSPEWYYDRLPPEVGMPKPKKQKPQQQQGQQGSGDQAQDEQGEGDGAGDQSEGADDSDESSTSGESGGDVGDDEGDEDEGAGDGSDDESDDESDEDGAGDDGEEDDDPSWDDVLDPPAGTEEDPVPSEADWRQAVTQAAAVARGTMPDSVRRLVKEVSKSKIDYRTAMRKFYQEVAKDDWTWARPHPRYIPFGQYQPSRRSEGLGVVAVFIDTSGSIDDVALKQAQSETQAMWEELRPRELRVGYIDAELHRVDVFVRGEHDTITFDACGGGGTDFRPAFESLKDWDEEPVCVVYVTDLAGTFPESDPGYPTLWVTARDDEPRVPFGDVVFLS